MSADMDAAVEAAARALFAWDVEEHSDPAPTWGALTEAQRDVWRSGARVALPAALPALRKSWEKEDADWRAIAALEKHLDHFESQQHSTVQISWLRRHFASRFTR